MQQIYAKIKKSSKYYYQNKTAIENGMGFPFKVHIHISTDYPVWGGPGSYYRLSDVNLYVIDKKGNELKIS